MSLLERFVHRGRAQTGGTDVCAHNEFAPMWESVVDMGRRDRITRSKCNACGVILPVAEAQALVERRTRRQTAA